MEILSSTKSQPVNEFVLSNHITSFLKLFNEGFCNASEREVVADSLTKYTDPDTSCAEMYEILFELAAHYANNVHTSPEPIPDI